MSDDLTKLSTEQLLMAFRRLPRLPGGVNQRAMQEIEGYLEEARRRDALLEQQPDWDQAPDWAIFWTRDVSGVTMWWETKPVYDGRIGAWMCEDESRRARGTDTALLRKRPCVSGKRNST